MRGDGLGLALGVDRLDGLGADSVADEPVRALAEQDLAGRCRLLEAGGDVDGVAVRASVCPSPESTSPVLTPVRASIRTPKSRSSSSFSSPRASRMSAAARTARSASSSCRVGIPNTAMTASPMNFSTVPPWRSIAELIVS